MKQITLILLVCLLRADVALADNTNGLPVLTLTDAETIALKNHPQIAAANYRALAAQEVVKETVRDIFRMQASMSTPWAPIPRARGSRPVA